MTPPVRNARSPCGSRSTFLLALGCLIVWPNTFVGTRPCVAAKRCLKRCDFRTVPRAFPATGQDQGQKSFLWIKVKRGRFPIEVEIAGLRNVASLLRKVRTLLPRKFSGVDEDDVCLYLNEKAKGRGEEPFQPDMSLSDLVTPTAQTALYVDFPGPSRRTKGRPLPTALTLADFVDNLGDCQYPKYDGNLNHLVNVAPCVQQCFEQVQKWLPKTGNGEQRVQPCMLSRCMRGGKTTILRLLFNKLRERGYYPIFLSFNSDHYIRRLERERDSIETLLRALAIAVMKIQPDTAADVQCSKEILREYFSRKTNVVLLIDEINILLSSKSADKHQGVGDFLRSEFLDTAGRFLVFSTHLPITAGMNELLGAGRGSTRDATPIPMPSSYNLTVLRGMAPQCRALTACQVAFYSGIPALIFTVMTTPEFQFGKRFKTARGSQKVTSALVASFLEEFFTGEAEEAAPVRSFDLLTEYSSAVQLHHPKLRWVVGYVGLMCQWLSKVSGDDYFAFQSVAQKLNELSVYQGEEGSGKVWEVTTQIAILLRCLHAKYQGVPPHELLGLKGRSFAGVYVHRFRGAAIQEAKAEWLQERIQRGHLYPHVALLIPSNDSFREFDEVLIYCADATSMWVVGFQNKLGKKGPMQDPSKEVNVGIWLHGKADERTPIATTWVCPTTEEIADFLGNSLQPSYPGAWPEG